MDLTELRNSLEQYNDQLSQVDAALNITTEGEEFDSLTSLKSDLLELINLTNENIEKILSQDSSGSKSISLPNSTSSKVTVSKDNDLDEEYALFMSEMEKSGAFDEAQKETPINEEVGTLGQISTEREPVPLEGKKCAVYFTHKWGGAPSLYNAMVCSVLNDDTDCSLKDDDIQVRIMFTNPTHIDMVPCPYYLDGECKFDENNCRYSHGEVVSLSALQDAVYPNFDILKPGTKVLTKIKKKDEAMSNKQSEKYMLWHRASIKSIDIQNSTCRVKLESDVLFKSGKENDYEVDFEYIFPLNDDSISSDVDLNSSDCDSDEEFKKYMEASINNVIVEKSILNSNPTALGDWEKYTKGIGSKLMMKMGYIIGTGLGPKGEGRIHPVPCRVTPNGRSLDHCMELREEAQNEDPIKTEKRLLKRQKKKEEREKKAYEKLKNEEKHDVFNFLNNTLAKNVDTKNKHNKTKEVSDIKSSSCKTLNIEKFKLDEDIRKTEKDILKIKSAMTRNINNGNIRKELSLKLSSKIEEVESLKRKQLNISNEQSNRKERKKLTIF